MGIVYLTKKQTTELGEGRWLCMARCGLRGRGAYLLLDVALRGTDCLHTFASCGQSVVCVIVAASRCTNFSVVQLRSNFSEVRVQLHSNFSEVIQLQAKI